MAMRRRLLIRMSYRHDGAISIVRGIRVPDLSGDLLGKLALQPLLDPAYENGRYDRTIDYSRPPDPPLEEDDAA